MKSKVQFSLSIFLLCIICKSQISFNEREIINYLFYNPINFTLISDMNNDGFPELFIPAHASNDLPVSPYFYYLNNHNGDYKYNPSVVNESFYNYQIRHLVDIDNDGFEDIVALYSGHDFRYCWLKNIDGQNFTPNCQFLINGVSDNLVADYFYDFDEDGFMDYFTVSTSGHIYKHINNQQGGFLQKESIAYSNISMPSSAKELSFYDFNNDGFKDLYLRTVFDQLLVYINDGNGLLYKKIEVSPGGNKVHLESFDFDGNSIQDFIYYSDNYLRIRKYFYNQSQDQYTYQDQLIDTPTTMHYNSGVIRAKLYDLNQDGLKDILATSGPNESYSTEFYYYENLGNSQFAEKKLIKSNNFKLNDFIVKDFNNDNLVDILLLSGHSADYLSLKYSIMYNDGEEGFTEKIIEQGISTSSQVFFEDVNNDGLEDIINGKNNLFWLENRGNNDWSGRRFIESLDVNSDFNNQYDLVDLNNDGLFDVVSNQIHNLNSNGNKFSIFINQGNMNFDKVYEIQNEPIEYWNRFKVYKTDQIQYPDIYYLKERDFENNTHDFFYIKNIQGEFQEPTPITIEPQGIYPTPTHERFVLADLNGDNQPEILYYDGYYKILYCLVNQGNYHYTRVNIQTGLNIHTMNIKPIDYDSDGDLDILISDLSLNNDFYILENNNMTFTKKLIDSDKSIDDTIFHDFNDDGLTDIVTLSFVSSQITLYENKGNYYEKSVIDEFSGDSHDQRGKLYLHDKNLDGDLDILVSHPSRTLIYYLLNTTNLEITEQNNSTEKSIVYPNPFSNIINWKAFSDKYHLIITDLTGKIIIEKQTKETHFDLNFLERGIYILNLNNQSFKIIKK